MTDPYQPPAASPVRSAVRPVLIALATSVVGLGWMFLALLLTVGAPAGTMAIGGTAIGLGGAIGATLLAVRHPAGASWIGAAIGTSSALFWTVIGAWVGVWASTGFARGRQLRERGVLRFAPVEPGAGWAPDTAPIDVPADVRAGLAAAWRENGSTEHASVAAFARVSLELVALGAPPALLADASRDTLDEIRHAELCFGLARALDGHAASPGPFPEATTAGALAGGRTARLVALAVTSLVDGALHEGVSARVIAKLARRCELDAVRAVLVELAADEGRHAAHGWDVVAWCVEVGGAPVRAALEAAAAKIPDEARSPLPPDAEDGSWERYGIVGRALEREQYALARAQVTARLRRLLDAPRRAAA